MSAPSVDAAAIPTQLKERNQWVAWLAKRRDDKFTKVPVIAGEKPTGPAKSTDPSTWRSFEEALASLRWADGIGFVFAEDDPFCGVDLDDCLVGGEPADGARAIVGRLDTYAETSPSGTGVHLIVFASLDGHDRNRTGDVSWGGVFEVYDSKRFFTVTGATLNGARGIESRQAELDEILAQIWPPKQEPLTAPPLVAPLDDQEILRRAGEAANGERFRCLFAGDTSGYDSPSEADLGLLGMLSFWTQDREQLDRLFQRSALFREDKWNRDTYRERTLDRALSGGETYTPSTAVTTSAVPTSGARLEFTAIPLDPEKMRAPRFLWDLRILMGALNSLVGTGGAGKGTLVGYLAGLLTRGALPGALYGTPSNMLIVGDEDDLDEIWTPRVLAAGGDPNHVFGLEYSAGAALDLTLNIARLEEVVRQHDIQLIYFDQILDNLGAGLNANLPQDVRRGLAPARGLARRLGRAVLYTAHPKKAHGEHSLRDRTGGSHQFTDLPRCGLILGYHPDDPERRVLARGKGNVGRTPPAFTFTIEETFVEHPKTGKAIETVVVENQELDDELTAEEVYTDKRGERRPSKSDQALDLLRGLGSDGRWRSRKETEAVCVSAGYSSRMFEKVFEQLEKETQPGEQDKREIQWRLRDAD